MGNKDYIQAAIESAKPSINFSSNAPPQYKDRQRQYLSKSTKAFVQSKAKYSSDFVGAYVQGLDPSDFYAYTPVKIRLSDVSSLSAISKKKTDDYKEILFENGNIDYIPRGAKIKTMGSTWIVSNPENLSSAVCTALIVRCNTTFNSYDAYGNIVTEPIFISNEAMTGNGNVPEQNLMLMHGYFNVVCQLNDNTKRLNQDRRFILGTKAYNITGFQDFIQEFTGNRDSVHLLNFFCHIEEPTELDDISENFIANGKSYSFSVELTGRNKLFLNTAAKAERVFPRFISNGEESNLPVTWKFESSDENILTVDINGNVYARSAGTAKVKATMQENTSLSAELEIEVSEEEIPHSVTEFVGYCRPKLRQNESAVYRASNFIDSVETDDAVFYTFSGADPSCYDYVQNGKELTVTCLGYSEKPLILSAYSNGRETENPIAIRLTGY